MILLILVRNNQYHEKRERNAPRDMAAACCARKIVGVSLQNMKECLFKTSFSSTARSASGPTISTRCSGGVFFNFSMVAISELPFGSK